MEPNEFSILSAFLASRPAEVGGRGEARLSAEDEKALSRLAGGELEARAMECLLPLLGRDAAALEFLAREIKRRRGEKRDVSS